MTELESKILAALPVSVERLLEENAIPEKQIRSAIKNLFTQGKIIKVGKEYRHAQL